MDESYYYSIDSGDHPATLKEWRERKECTWSNMQVQGCPLAKLQLIHELDENSPRATQPPAIIVPLYIHQLTALKEMQHREDGKIRIQQNKDTIVIDSSMGILGDTPGKGKTLIILALIASSVPTIKERVVRVDLDGLNLCNIELRRTIDLTPTQATLIVVPHKLLKQWSIEIDKNTTLQYNVFKPTKVAPSTNVDIILCSNTAYSACMERYSTIHWRRFILDEADSPLKLTVFPKCDYTWFVTGSYTTLLDGSRHDIIGDIFRRFRRIDTPLYELIVVRNSIQYMDKSVLLPARIERVVPCRLSGMVKAVREFITQEVAEMLYSGNIDGAVEALGGCVENGRNLGALLIKQLEKTIHNTTQERVYVESLEIEDKERKDRLSKIDKEIRSNKERLLEVQTKLQHLDAEECLICYGVLDKPTMLMCCKNVFCGKCILAWFHQWLKNVCPMCKTELEMSKVVSITSKEYHITTQAKHKTLGKLIQDNPNGKYLVFSLHEASFAEIGITLKELDIKYAMIKGIEYTTNLRHFRDGTIRVLLLNARYNAAGLDLSMASNVVLYHKMPRDVELQAIGRGDRIGRKDSLIVERLLCEGE